MPAVSKTQQKLFGIVHAIQTGRANPKKFSKSARRLAKTMSHADVKKYATTPVSDLPKKIAELLKQDVNAGAEVTKETIGTVAVGGPVTDFPPATSQQPHVSADPNRVDFEDEEYNPKQNAIMAVVKNRKPATIDGTTVDLYTAALLHKVIGSLTGENKHKFLQMPVDKMVATAYKLVTR